MECQTAACIIAFAVCAYPWDEYQVSSDELVAARALSKESIPLDWPVDIRTLIEKTFSDASAVRGEAALGLGAMGERAAVAAPFLIRMFDDTEPCRIAHEELAYTVNISPGLCASMAYEQLGIPRTDLLILASVNASSSCRSTAVSLLGSSGDPRAGTALIARLKDVDGHVRASTIWALAKLADPRAVIPLAEFIEDESQKNTERRLAAWLLGQFGGALAVDTLIRVAADEDEDHWVRQDAAVGLGYTQQQRAVDALLCMLNHEDKIVREGVFWGLARAANQRVIGPFVTALNDDNENGTIRGAAAIGLGRTKDRLAVDYLLEITDRETVPHVMVSILTGLVLSEDLRASQYVLSALEGYNVRLSWAAASALRESNDPNAVLPLIDALKRSDWAIRSCAVVALEKLKDPRAVPALQALVDDKNEKYLIRRRARNTILKMRRELTPFDDFAISFSENRLAASTARRDVLGP